MKAIYLAGPMTGVPQFNIPLFEQAARELRRQGYRVTCPPELDSEDVYRAAMKSKDGSLLHGKLGGETWGQMLGRDIAIVADKVDTVVFLPGWQHSKGALLEAYVGLVTKKNFYVYDPYEKTTHRLKTVDVVIAIKRKMLEVLQ